MTSIDTDTQPMQRLDVAAAGEDLLLLAGAVTAMRDALEVLDSGEPVVTRAIKAREILARALAGEAEDSPCVLATGGAAQ